MIRRTQKPLSSLWKVTRSTRPARTSWVDGSCCGFMSIILSSASALGTPIPWHIDVTGPDGCAALPGGVLVNNVVFRISPKCACDDGALRPLSKTAKQLNSLFSVEATKSAVVPAKPAIRSDSAAQACAAFSLKTCPACGSCGAFHYRSGKCDSEQARAKQDKTANGHSEETVRS